METKAFGGRFPSQVQVELFYKFPTIPGGSLRKMLKGDRNRQRRLTRRQTHEILASMTSYTYYRRDAGKLETLSRQRKKSPADRPVQPPAMSSGSPIYIYNPKKIPRVFDKDHDCITSQLKRFRSSVNSNPSIQAISHRDLPATASFACGQNTTVQTWGYAQR